MAIKNLCLYAWVNMAFLVKDMGHTERRSVNVGVSFVCPNIIEISNS